MQDASRKRRLKIGEAASWSKLTEEQVHAIRSDDRAMRKIANDYSVSYSTVHEIKLRKIWKHI
jgi:hypothetical protein